MVNLNDYKILSQKCLNYFNLLEKEIKFDASLFNKKNKERFGFYIYMLEALCNIKDISDIVNLVTDRDFNQKLFGIQNDDNGVDAIFIDDENNYIDLFNFKYRENFVPGKQQRADEAFMSEKFLLSIKNKNGSGISGKLKINFDSILERLDSSNIWKIRLYSVTNEAVELSDNFPVCELLKNEYDLEFKSIGLPTIAQIMTLRPNPINCKLHLNNNELFSFKESDLSSAVSYIIQIPASELIRITCNDAGTRDKYNMEDYSILSEKDMEFGVLFDNVRGYITRSKFNLNILKVLQDEPLKFFMYNNGLTFIANNITASATNARKKTQIELRDFQVVNGGQTLRTIHRFNKMNKNNIDNYLPDCKVLIRIFNISSESPSIRDKIAEYTNSQNSISNIDLKSLDSIQLEIEQYLNNYNIIYARKLGDLGISAKKYSLKISMEKFGQILFSIQGSPNKASNNKKQIFDKYYDQVFKENFNLNNSVEYINKYFEIREKYNSFMNENVADQRIFYILYLIYKTHLSIDQEIKFFEKVLTMFYELDKESHTKARILIRKDFQDFLDSKIDSSRKE